MGAEKPNSEMPERMRSLFWWIHFDKINPEEEAGLVVSQVINYGDLEDWKWIKNRYGRDRIVRILCIYPITQFRPSVLKLASAIFNFDIADCNDNLRATEGYKAHAAKLGGFDNL